MLREALAQPVLQFPTRPNQTERTVTTAQMWRWGSAALPNSVLLGRWLQVYIKKTNKKKQVELKTAMMKMMMIRQESSARPLIALIRCWWWSRDLRDFLSLVRSSAYDSFTFRCKYKQGTRPNASSEYHLVDLYVFMHLIASYLFNIQYIWS